jgi:hypothetical protein
VRALIAVAVLVVLTGLAGCGGGSTLDDVGGDGGTDGTSDGSGGSDGTDTSRSSGGSRLAGAPEVGACRVLAAEDVAEPSNDTEPVACREDHTAETFHVGEFEGDPAYDDPALAAEVYDDCQGRWVKFTGADESLALRTVLSWAWFRPTEEQWDEGARWFRCDVVGGLERPDGLITLPASSKGVLLGIPPDRWMACVNADTVQEAAFLPCTEEHTWRAVSTIVVSEKKAFPGTRLVEVLSRDFCSDSVLAWLDYPPQYDFGYTYFGEPEWEAGNNRAICWARTSE